MSLPQRDITKSDAFIPHEDVARAVGPRLLLSVREIIACVVGVSPDDITAFDIEESPFHYGLIIRRLRVRKS